MEMLKNFKENIRFRLQKFRKPQVQNVKVNFITVQPIEVKVELPPDEHQCEPSANGDVEKTPKNPNDSDNGQTESEHVQAIYFLIKIVHFFSTPLGIRLDRNWKINSLSRFTFFMFSCSTFLIVYSIYFYRDNIFKLVECFSLLGMLLPAGVKLRLSFTKIKQATSVYYFVEEVYKLNSSGPIAETLNKNTRQIVRRIIFLIAVLFSAFVCFAGYPLYKLIYDGELISLLTFEIPFVDQNETSGFIIANIIMLVVGIYGVFGSIAFDVFFATNIMLYSSLVKILKYDLERFASMWENEDVSVGVNYCNAYLRNILMKFSDIDKYVITISDIYSNALFIQMASAYACITMALFAVAINNWISGVGFVIFCFTEMFLLCYLGTTLTVQNDEMCDMIYDSPWYLYPTKTQKLFLLLLHRAQNFRKLWIGSFAPLNVETGLNITKSIYSYFTMLLNFIE